MGKKLGQHFLKSQRILSYIANICEGKAALEIGGGDGRLTKKLLKKFEKVFVVELDKKFCEKLKELGENKLEIICSDFLKIKPFKVDCIVGNIPYYLSSKILFRLLDWDFRKAVLMFQKEFAEKMVAKEGGKNYGRLSVMCSFYFKVKIKKIVKRNFFSPPPKVDSAIVEVIKIREKTPENESFEDLVRKLFSRKNKLLKNVVKEIPERFHKKRARELSLKEIMEIWEELREKKGKTNVREG